MPTSLLICRETFRNKSPHHTLIFSHYYEINPVLKLWDIIDSFGNVSATFY